MQYQTPCNNKQLALDAGLAELLITAMPTSTLLNTYFSRVQVYKDQQVEHNIIAILVMN